MKKILFSLISIFFVSCMCFSQNNTTAIGFFYGPSIGYNATHSGLNNDHGLLDISFATGESFGNSIVMLDDDNLIDNVELFNVLYLFIAHISGYSLFIFRKIQIERCR